jgi:hypothetical protein
MKEPRSFAPLDSRVGCPHAILVWRLCTTRAAVISSTLDRRFH